MRRVGVVVNDTDTYLPDVVHGLHPTRRSDSGYPLSCIRLTWAPEHQVGLECIYPR